jgi:steroid delta-isomerase-like uncharacterized protein
MGLASTEVEDMGSPRDLLEGIGNAITGDAAQLEKICTADVEFEDSVQSAKGIPAVTEYLRSWSTAFPDATTSIGRVVAGDDQAVGEMLYRGTQTGPMATAQGAIPATGRTVELKGAAWITIRDGKIARFNGYYDTMTMMVQLGLMPAPATA